VAPTKTTTSPTPQTPANTRRIVRMLRTQHPGAFTELVFRDAYELLIATVLSAQCTDTRVNQVTPALFTRYPTANLLAGAKPQVLERLIQPTGFFRSKARSLIGMASVVVEQHNGMIPDRLEALVRLPGVGRKTANVVLGHAFGVPGLPVDRHVLRVSNRLGIANSDDPVVVEQQLAEVLPPADWTITSDTLILHGRRVCKPKPRCDACDVQRLCRHTAQGATTTPAQPLPPTTRASGRTPKGARKK